MPWHDLFLTYALHTSAFWIRSTPLVDYIYKVLFRHRKNHTCRSMEDQNTLGGVEEE